MDFVLSLLRQRTVSVLGFFIVLLGIGYFSRGAYGVSADEPTMIRYGLEVYQYLFHGGPMTGLQDWKFFSPIVPVLMTAIQHMFGELYADEVFALRHFLNFLMFFGTTVAFYQISLKLTRDWRLSLLGCLLLVLSPRIFAHAFYNPKDIPTLFLFTLSMLALFRLREGWSLLNVFLCALSCALLISLRSVGLLVVGFTVWSIFSSTSCKGSLRRLGMYLLFLILLTIVVWPLLWTNTIENFLFAFSNNVSREGGSLYMGITGADHPWHYVLVWIFITTPILYSVFSIIGTIVVGWNMVKNPLRLVCFPSNQHLVFLWFWLPVLASVFLGIQIFNEWRHLMFIYPAFLLLALFALQKILVFTTDRTRVQKAATYAGALALGLNVLFTSWWMIKNHPLQFAYFSIPSSWVEGNFELDYWALSYRQGLEKVAALDDRPIINIYPAERIAVGSMLTIDPAQYQRLKLVPAASADYILDAFIGSQYKPRNVTAEIVDSVQVDGLTLLTIYKGPDTAGVYADHQYE